MSIAYPVDMPQYLLSPNLVQGPISFDLHVFQLFLRALSLSTVMLAPDLSCNLLEPLRYVTNAASKSYRGFRIDRILG